jgi:phytoene synthase
LWAWHSGLADPQPPGSNGTEDAVATYFDEEQERAEAGEPLRLLRTEVCENAYRACAEHDLDRSLLAAQVDAARVLYGSTQFETSSALKTFVGRWAVPHGRLLARLAGIDLSAQLRYADELARGFFHLGRLLTLPRDVGQGRLFIPLDALEQKGVTVDQLREGTVDDAVQGLLWRESVRVRDALAQGRPLIANLSLRHRFALKRFWVGALELLKELDRRDYDLWSEPLTLSFFRRVQVYVQTLLGRSVSR